VIVFQPFGQKYFMLGQKEGHASAAAAPLHRHENATSPRFSRSSSMSLKPNVNGTVVKVNIFMFSQSTLINRHNSFTADGPAGLSG
jgi:hypothetical protein